MKQVDGGCLCGALRVSARGAPLRVGICHCRDCRKHHGAPFYAAAIFPKLAVTIKAFPAFVDAKHIAFRVRPKGEAANKRFKISWKRFSGSSNSYAGRHFCPTCGSSVFAVSGDEVEVHLGALDHSSVFKPDYECWTDRREGWLPPLAGAGQFAGNRHAG